MLKVPKHIPEMDGLRGYAVLAVMVFHSCALLHIEAFHIAGYGWTGVDLFFALSGFLITGILLDTKDSRFFFTNFYARRILRIWPLYYLLVACSFAIVPLTIQHVGFFRAHYYRSLTAGWVIHVVFLQNIWNGIHGISGGGALLGATWSLAIEEQFYVFWPLIVYRSSRKTLVGILVSVLLVSPVGRALALHFGAGGELLYKFTPFRLDGLAVGSLIALWVRSESFSVMQFRRVTLITGIIGAVGCILLVPSQLSIPAPALAYSFLAIACGAALACGLYWNQTGSACGRLLNWRCVRYTGRISYCLYLIHLPIFTFFSSNTILRIVHFRHHQRIYIGLVFLIEFGIAYLVASLSWYGFEGPILRLKKRFESLTPLRTFPSQQAAVKVVSCGPLPPSQELCSLKYD